MVGNNSERNVCFLVLFIFNLCNIRNMLHYICNSVYLKEIVHALHYCSKTFKAHTCVDIGVCKAVIVALLVFVELGKHQVPHFHKSVAVTAQLTIGLAAAVLRASVNMNF